MSMLTYYYYVAFIRLRLAVCLKSYIDTDLYMSMHIMHRVEFYNCPTSHNFTYKQAKSRARGCDLD